jgi:hypothetical protein
MAKYVGHSYSRCILDIYEGNVNYNDIAVIITRTRFDPLNLEHWEKIWDGYSSLFSSSASNWYEYRDDTDAKKQFYEITVMLHNDGLLHQPRNFGSSSAWSSPYVWSKIEPVNYEEMKKSDGEKWGLPTKNKKMSDTEFDKVIQQFGF